MIQGVYDLGEFVSDTNLKAKKVVKEFVCFREIRTKRDISGHTK